MREVPYRTAVALREVVLTASMQSLTGRDTSLRFS